MRISGSRWIVALEHEYILRVYMDAPKTLSMNRVKRVDRTTYKMEKGCYKHNR